MAHFPNSYPTILPGTEPVGDVPFLLGNGTRNTLDLIKGQLGVVDKNNQHKLINISALPTGLTFPLIYLASGSFHASDTLGGSMHGGMQETIKTKYINPKYVSKFYKTIPELPINQVVQVSADGCELDCNKTYWLRVDIKGSPALRFLARNAYLTVDGFTGCCNTVEDPIDPNVVMLQWADQINVHPTLSPFVQATVWNDVTALAPTTLSITSGVGTVGSATGIAAGQRVIFTPSVAITTDKWVISGKTLTLTSSGATLTGLFTVGQTITDAGGLISAGTKLVKLVSGDGGLGSVFLINNPHDITVTSSNDLTATGSCVCYIGSTYVAGNTIPVPLVVATFVQTAGTTAIDTAYTDTSITVPQFFGVITTAGYTALTADVDEISSFIELVGAYASTVFEDCSFDVRDHFEIEPVKIYASIVDESGDPCEVYCFSVAEVTTAYQGKGYGETLLQELILAQRYRQEDWTPDVRMREVLGNTAMSAISRDEKYYVYHILHSVPRKANPDGTMDNDQYLVKLVISEAGFVHGTVAQFEAWMNRWLLNHSNPVVCEYIP